MKTELEEIISYYRYGKNGKSVLSWDQEEYLEYWYPHHSRMNSFSHNEVHEFRDKGFWIYNINDEKYIFIPRTNILAITLNEVYLMDRREKYVNTAKYDLEINFE